MAGLVYLYELSRTSPYLCVPWFSHLLEGHKDVLTFTELCGEEPSQQKWKSVEKYKTLNIFSKCFDGLSLVFWAWTGVTVRADSALVLVVPLFLSVLPPIPSPKQPNESKWKTWTLGPTVTQWRIPNSARCNWKLQKAYSFSSLKVDSKCFLTTSVWERLRCTVWEIKLIRSLL